MNNLIDHGRLAAIAQGSATSQGDVLAAFRRANSDDTALLHKAADAGDFAQMNALAHRIKGACMMLGATRSAESCSLTALAARACDPVAAREALVFLDRHMADLEAHLDALCVDTAPASPAHPQAMEHAALCSGLSFMVVEDHAFQRDIIVRFLRRLGATDVRGFSDGGPALAALKAASADIMILDLSMPGMDGMQLMRELSATAHPVALIVNSALGPSLLASLLQVTRNYRVRILGALCKPLTEASLAPLMAQYRSGLAAPSPHAALAEGHS